MHKWIYQFCNSISTKVIFIMIILVFPLNLIAIIESKHVMNTMIRQNQMGAQTLADTFISDISDRMDNTQSLLYYQFTENSDFIRMKLQNEVNYTYSSSKYKFYYSLHVLADMTDGADGYFYHMKKLNDTLVYDSSPEESNRLYSTIDRFLSDQMMHGIKSGWHIYEFNSKRYLVFMVDLKNITYGGWFNLDKMIKDIGNHLQYTDYRIDFTEKVTRQNLRDRIMVTSGMKGINFVISIKKNEIVGGVSLYLKILQATTFLYLALIPVLFLLLRFLLIHPLNNINYAHRQIKKGKQEFRIEKNAHSTEFLEAYRSFNEMADNLTALKIDSYEKEIAKQRMELRNLQLQIRPHFLLNTFNLIYTLAQRKEIIAIQQIIIYLSDYFRYIFRSDKELELFSKELKLVRGYIKMVSINYSGNIQVNYDVDPEINFVRVPPLLIHNFIENSVKYGYKQGEILNITIMGRYSDRMVTLYVSDDGNGMDEESLNKCRKLLSGEIEPNKLSSNIGLQNSMKRIKYFYGNEAMIDITSEQGIMTCVKIQFPYNLEVQDDTIISE